MLILQNFTGKRRQFSATHIAIKVLQRIRFNSLFSSCFAFLATKVFTSQFSASPLNQTLLLRTCPTPHLFPPLVFSGMSLNMGQTVPPITTTFDVWRKWCKLLFPPHAVQPDQAAAHRPLTLTSISPYRIDIFLCSQKYTHHEHPFYLIKVWH